MTVIPTPARKLDPKVRFALGDALFTELIATTREAKGRPVIAGLCGPQGSGKSTTAGRLVQRLEASGYRVASLSLDDFYLTHAERGQLARDVHPCCWRAGALARGRSIQTRSPNLSTPSNAMRIATASGVASSTTGCAASERKHARPRIDQGTH